MKRLTLYAIAGLALVAGFLSAPMSPILEAAARVIDSKLSVGESATRTSPTLADTLTIADPTGSISVRQIRSDTDVAYPFQTFEHRTTATGAAVSKYEWRIDSSGNLILHDDIAAADRITVGFTTGVVTFGVAPTFSALTATRVPFAGVAGALTDDADLTFVTDTLSATKVNTSGVQGAYATKTLVDAAAAAAFVKITMPSNSYIGGNIDYSVESSDATDFQARSGNLVFSAVSKVAAITCTVGTVTTAVEVIATSSGTLANTFSCADATGGVLNILTAADSSLTPTTLRIRYRVNTTNSGVTVAPQ